MLTEHFLIYMQILAVQSVFMGVSLRLSVMKMEMEIAMPGTSVTNRIKPKVIVCYLIITIMFPRK